MVKWIRDPTGRFAERPFYEPLEIDNECERTILEFMKKLSRPVTYPISTDDLTKLIEQHASDLDVYADLSADGVEVEGVTRFARNRKPAIAIANNLTESDARQNRFRTTLTHEFGHLRLHDVLFQMKFSSSDLFAKASDDRVICKRDRMIDAPKSDWLEWQACYASGAYLMPKSAMSRLVDEFRRARSVPGVISVSHENGQQLIELIRSRFEVSADAARVRSLKLGFLSNGATQPILFEGH